MSSRNEAVYEQQCERWHNELLIEFEENNTSNLMERLDAIEKVVNKECNKHSLEHDGFTIGLKQRQNLLTLYNKDLREHTIVSHNKCAEEIKNVKQYKQKARNKLNRWKPKVFGDHVLYQIIFINTYNYCYEVGRSMGCQWDDSIKCQWDDTDIKNLFITIFCKLLDATIRFKKTRDVRLILSTVFSTNTRFRRSCIFFLEHFNESISWNIKSGKKAAEKADSFKKCLQKIFNYEQVIIPPPIVINEMDITEASRRCDVYYIPIIKKFIIKCEYESYMNYYDKISTSNIFSNVITLINEYFTDSMSFWSVTPRKSMRRIYNSNYTDDDGDFCITPFHNIPSVINTNIAPINYDTFNFNDNPSMMNNVSNTSHDSMVSMNDTSIPPSLNHSNSDGTIYRLMHSNSNRSISYDTIPNQSYLSRGTSTGSSYSSIPDANQLPHLPMLNDTDNLQPINSGEEMLYDNIQRFNVNENIIDQAMEVENNNLLYDNSQLMNDNNYMNIPQLIQELPPPIRNTNNYTQVNPHISQHMPPPHVNINNYYQPSQVTVNTNNFTVNNNRNNNFNTNNNNINNDFNFHSFTQSINNNYDSNTINAFNMNINNDRMQYDNSNCYNDIPFDSNQMMNYENSIPINQQYEYSNNNNNNNNNNNQIQMQMDSMPNIITNDNYNNNNMFIDNQSQQPQMQMQMQMQMQQSMNSMNYNYNNNNYPRQMDL